MNNKHSNALRNKNIPPSSEILPQPNQTKKQLGTLNKTAFLEEVSPIHKLLPELTNTFFLDHHGFFFLF